MTNARRQKTPEGSLPPLPELERKGNAVRATPALIEWVETVTALGLGPSEISEAIGISERTFYRKFRSVGTRQTPEGASLEELGELVEILAGIGISVQEISSVIGFSKTKTLEHFGKVIKGAPQRVTGKVIRAMYRRTLLETSVGQRAGEFWLRVQAGWETPMDTLVKQRLGRRSPFSEEFDDGPDGPLPDEVKALPMGEARVLIRETMRHLDREGRDAMRKVLAQLKAGDGEVMEAEIVGGD